MTRYPANFQPLAHLVEGRHRYCMELSSAMAALMLVIQANFGTEELNRITLEADHAVS